MTHFSRQTMFGFVVFAAVSAGGVRLAAQQAPGNVRWFSAADVAGQRSSSGRPWLALLDTATLSIGRYALGVGATDGRSPHARDEVYFVVSGRAKLEAGGETRAVAAGDSVFVAAGTPHRFLDVAADLDVLVFFSAARPPTGGMAAGPVPTEQTPFPETSQRGNARIFYWFGPDSAGQVSIDHGQPKWQTNFDAFMSKPSGRRWRLGQNFWTTLDTNMALTIAGVKVPVGGYYAVLENRVADGMRLVLLDPAEVRAKRLDAYEAAKTTGGLSIPLRAGEHGSFSGRLAITLDVDREQRDQATLEIRFGPHTLTAPVQMHPHRK